MAEKHGNDKTLDLLQEVHAAAVAAGHRDDPLTMRIAAAIEAAKPSTAPPASPPKASHR